MKKANVLSLSSSFVTLVLSLTTPAHSEGVYTTLSIPGASIVSASGINDFHQVVGGYGIGDIFTPDFVEHGFFYTNASTIRRWTILGQRSTRITGFNNYGDMIGSYSTDQNSFSFVYSQGSYTTLSVPGASMMGADRV